MVHPEVMWRTKMPLSQRFTLESDISGIESSTQIPAATARDEPLTLDISRLESMPPELPQ